MTLEIAMPWDFSTPGIPDELFDRDELVPITKEDVRSLVISKLRLKEGFSAIDIGCGSGSITVELCIQTKSENIYAIDFDERAIELTNRNLQKFGLKSRVILSKAEDILPSIPEVDAVVVGGTWGNTEQIIEMAIERLKVGGRIVIDTILIETMYKALTAFNRSDLHEVDVTQVIIAKARKVSKGTMMIARNPVLILSATRN
ncbi:MAG: precorrin-6Y C5,15-methyltransferase (decarboxylating) subunit CbiT [Nitrososphaeraceae archaeon]|jgi:cobalt-precorrin-6B (C15)-methyltransferase